MNNHNKDSGFDVQIMILVPTPNAAKHTSKPEKTPMEGEKHWNKQHNIHTPIFSPLVFNLIGERTEAILRARIGDTINIDLKTNGSAYLFFNSMTTFGDFDFQETGILLNEGGVGRIDHFEGHNNVEQFNRKNDEICSWENQISLDVSPNLSINIVSTTASVPGITKDVFGGLVKVF